MNNTEEEIARCIEHRRKVAAEQMEYYRNALKEEQDRLDKIESEVRAEYANRDEAIAKLTLAGITDYYTRGWNADLEVSVTESQLKTVFKALGPFDVRSVHKTVDDAAKHLILVTLPLRNYPRVRVSYRKKLSRRSKCKIKTVVMKRKELVCER